MTTSVLLDEPHGDNNGYNGYNGYNGQDDCARPEQERVIGGVGTSLAMPAKRTESWRYRFYIIYIMRKTVSSGRSLCGLRAAMVSVFLVRVLLRRIAPLIDFMG